jgi:hypothetical protein
MSTKHVVHDGLDVRAEYRRLCKLECWSPKLRINPPRLDIAIFTKRPRRLGSAWQAMNRIKINLHSVQTRYDVYETLIHELAHVETYYRYPEKNISHGAEFWEVLDAAFAQAYPGAELLLAPRVNKYHGRYSKAIRELEIIDTGTTPHPGWKRVGAQVMVVPFTYQERQLPVAALETEEVKPKTTTTNELDERVLHLLTNHDHDPGITRAEIEVAYLRVYGEEYPGKSVYNSMWRLNRDGLIERQGRLWIRTKGNDDV